MTKGKTSKKKQGAQFPFSQFVAVVVITLSLFLVVDFARRTAATYQIKKEAARLEEEIATARAERQALEDRLRYVQSDAYVEEVARTQLKWAREGEVTVVVMPTPQAVPQPSADDRPVSVGDVTLESPWQAWWHLFFRTSPPESPGLSG
jgi:cell division protein FtsB